MLIVGYILGYSEIAMNTLNVLALESSCDETAVAVLRQKGVETEVLAENIYSQIPEHAEFGGVVPELAARAHIQHFPSLIEKTLHEADITEDTLDAVACTTGPGLIGGLLVGSMIARTLALRWQVPFYGIHHLEGHLLSPRLGKNTPEFPYLVLLASGGHTLIVLAKGLGNYEILGRSRDDALGEAFDKSAIIMDLTYPGGPILEQLAKQGDDQRFPLPSPLVGGRELSDRISCDFSFSGLKTAVSRLWRNLPELSESEREQARCDMAASLHRAVGNVLQNRLNNALRQFRTLYPEHRGEIPVVFVGGVAANEHLRTILHRLCERENATLSTVPMKLCTDNATMIGWAAIERIMAGLEPIAEHDQTRPRWSLEW